MLWALMVGAAWCWSICPGCRAAIWNGRCFAMPFLTLSARWPSSSAPPGPLHHCAERRAWSPADQRTPLGHHPADQQHGGGAGLLLWRQCLLAGRRGRDAPQSLRDSAECSALLLLILAGLAAWSLELRSAAFGWTSARLFVAIAVGFFAAYAWAQRRRPDGAWARSRLDARLAA